MEVKKLSSLTLAEAVRTRGLSVDSESVNLSVFPWTVWPLPISPMKKTSNSEKTSNSDWTTDTLRKPVWRVVLPLFRRKPLGPRALPISRQRCWRPTPSLDEFAELHERGWYCARNSSSLYLVFGDPRAVGAEMDDPQTLRGGVKIGADYYGRWPYRFCPLRTELGWWETVHREIRRWRRVGDAVTKH